MSEVVIKKQPATKLHEHIRELFFRLLFSVVSLLVVGIIIYLFYGPVIEILRAPLNAPLYYSSPAGSFAFMMKICFMGGLIIAIPVLVYNLIMFVRPALPEVITLKRVYTTSLTSSVLAISGAAFAYVVILPSSLKFFAGFQVSGLSALISADSYLNFVTGIITTFVVIFQLPLLITFIDNIKPIKPSRLLKNEKWVVLASLVIALLSPFTYDFVASLLIALPIIVLYNLSIGIVLLQHAKVARSARKAIHSTIIKPAFVSDIIVDDQVVIALADELEKFDRAEPIIANPRRTNDIVSRVVNKPQFKIQQTTPVADWVYERNLKRAALMSKKVHVFSDISIARQRVNRASA